MGNENGVEEEKRSELDEKARRALCTAAKHVNKVFECQGANCNMKPLLCSNCSYDSDDDPGIKFCKMCRVTEKMKNFDPDTAGLEIDNEHSIELVASVSFDRQKREFNYSKFDPTSFDGGVENFGNLK